MGTHPIFESDFDCLTEILITRWEAIPSLSKSAEDGSKIRVSARCPAPSRDHRVAQDRLHIRLNERRADVANDHLLYRPSAVEVTSRRDFLERRVGSCESCLVTLPAIITET